MRTVRSFVGMDVHKTTISIALQKTGGAVLFGSSA